MQIPSVKSKIFRINFAPFKVYETFDLKGFSCLISVEIDADLYFRHTYYIK